MNIYVGNLAPEVTEQDLENAFGEFGKIKSVKVIKDMFTQQSKGFGFVEMESTNEANQAIQKLNTAELKGKRITVNEARPPKNNRSGGGFGGGSRGSGGSSRGGGYGSGSGGRKRF